MIVAFTSAALNYLPKVMVLSSSIKKYHPEWSFYFILIEKDGTSLESIEGVNGVLTPSKLPIPNLRSFYFKYNLVEFATAIKPFAITYFFETINCEAVLYFDPDIVIFSRLDDLVSHFQEASILLTPHLSRPETDLEAIVDNEICSLKHGVYNLGFIGVKNDTIGRNFVRWWGERLRYFCLAEPEKGLWVDQRWVDLVPAFFEKVKVIRDSRFNVAPWNLSQRELTGSIDSGIFVDGKPLGFYHFTGFDSGAHEAMVDKYAPQNKTLKELIGWYKGKIRLFEKAIQWTLDTENTFDNGIPIKRVYREIYRRRLDLQVAFPDPYVTKGKSFYRWLKTQGWLEEPELVEPKGLKLFFRFIHRFDLSRRFIKALLRPREAAKRFYRILKRRFT